MEMENNEWRALSEHFVTASSFPLSLHRCTSCYGNFHEWLKSCRQWRCEFRAGWEAEEQGETCISPYLRMLCSSVIHFSPLDLILGTFELGIIMKYLSTFIRVFVPIFLPFTQQPCNYIFKSPFLFLTVDVNLLPNRVLFIMNVWNVTGANWSPSSFLFFCNSFY